MSTPNELQQDPIDTLATRHGFSVDAVRHLQHAVAQGHGCMASFNHPELGGAGQWMRGGLLMIADAFNHELKAQVDALCNALAELPGSQPGLGGSYAQQSQTQTSGGGAAGFAASAWQTATPWWPEELGTPTATGQQNELHYAYFAAPRRLAIRLGERMSVHDTGDHRITGVSQQQGNSLASLSFTSQHGPVNLASLPEVGAGSPPSSAPSSSRSSANAAPGSAGSEADVFDAIERLGDLKAKGLLSEEEFTAKKQALLARI
jgi:hypothetical protein